MKLKKAPYLKLQNNNPLDECFIIAGSDAFNSERKEQIILFTKAENNKQPIILDSEKLKIIDRLQIAPENKKYISIFKAGELSETDKNAICLNLAKNTQAETVQLVDEAMQAEDVSHYIKRIRQGEQTTTEIIAKSKPKAISLDLSQEKPTTPELVEYTGQADGLKAVTGGDTIKAKFLFNDYFDFEPTIVFMMSSNYPMTFTDRNGGIARRRVIIPFNRKIPKEKKDVHFIDKIKNEIYGITNYLLRAFPEPEIARQALELYQSNGAGDIVRQESNILYDFATAYG